MDGFKPFIDAEGNLVLPADYNRIRPGSFSPLVEITRGISMVSSAVAAKHFRFRNDDGSETSATWLAAQDTDATLTLSGNTAFRLRYVLEESSGSPTESFQLKVSYNGGAAALITATSTQVQGRVSSHLTDGANTTEQLSAAGTYTTTAGVVNQTAATSASITIPNLDCTEVEWSMVAIASALNNGDTLDFTFVGSSGTVTDTQFTSNVRLTISTATGALATLMMTGVGF